MVHDEKDMSHAHPSDVEEYLLTHLRVKEGISKKDYQKRFSKWSRGA